MSLAGAEKSYSKIFFVASHFFVLLALYSIYDESVVRRPWKAYQEEYNSYELQLAEQELGKIKDAYKKDGSDEKIAKLQLQLEEVEQQKQSGEFKKLKSTLAELQTEYDDFELQTKFKKSILDSDYYFWKHAVGEGKSAGHILEEQKKYTELDEEIKTRNLELAERKLKIDAVQAKIDAYDNQIQDLQNQVDALKAPVQAAQDKVKNISLRTIDIKQVVLEYGKQKQGNIKWGRVDRCQTCHVAMDKSGFEDVSKAWNLKVVKDDAAKKTIVDKKPELASWVVTLAEKERLQLLYGTHPKRSELFGSHPIEKFGCTSCHGGDGRGVNIHGEVFGANDKAHAYQHHAVEPLLRDDQMQSNCLSCHNGLVQLPGAEKLTQGLELFTQLGCQNCHAVDGYDNMFRVGPELNKVGAKVKADWLVDWIKNPHNYMPTSRMPNFGFSDAEAVAVASYLLAESEKFEPQKTYSIAQGSVQNGEKVFNQVGCMGCHSTDPAATDRGRAPNLGRLSAKVKDANWVMDWIQNPKNYSAHTRMPDLRLSEAEALDITAYLMALSPEYPAELGKRAASLVQQVDVKNQELIKSGQKIIGQRGCYSCHTLKGFEGFDRIGPNLTAEALKEPFEFDYGDAMAPNFTFTDVEGKKVFVGHLQTGHGGGHGGEEPAEKTSSILAKVKAANPEQAGKVDEVTNLESTWQSWVRNKLKYPLNIYKHERADLKMPSFNLSPDELDALLVFLKAMQNREVLPEYNAALSAKHKNIVKGQHLVAEKNCMGCHSIQGFGGEVGAKLDEKVHGGEKLTQFYPPSLTHVGMKIRPEWLHDFLSAPKPYRPGVKVRMPTYGFSDQQIGTLQNYFSSLDKMNLVLTDTNYKLDPELVSVGKILTDPTAFNCFSCHLMNGRTPGDDPKNWAPDWTLMHDRLQYDFIPLWIQNPVKYQDYAVMTPFLKTDAEAMPGYLGDKADAQLKALREYLFSIGH